MAENKASMVFESSWEVCNKCGGIYTVVTSKVPLMQAHYDNYVVIGPLFDTVPSDFLIEKAPEPFARVFASLASRGIRCQYGSWDIAGRPTTILIDARSLLQYQNDIKAHLWEAYQIDSLGAGYDFIEPVLWAWGVGIFLDEIAKQFPDDTVLGHFHEWLAGASCLYLHDVKSKVATVFTTHATMLGRSIASRDKNFPKNIETIDNLAKAKELGVMAKHTTERACARIADVFTTVSETTAREAECLLEVRPDILPNGLAMEYFPSFEEASYRHHEAKKKLTDYVISHFFPYEGTVTQPFDVNDTLYFFTSGRYEFENKGLDLVVDALAKLNKELQDAGSQKTIVMFFFLATYAKGAKRELIENVNNFSQLRSAIKSREDSLLQRIALDVMLGEDTDVEIVPQKFIESLESRFERMRRVGNPPLCTHRIDEENDPTLRACRERGLLNRPEDRVKIVVVPSYLDGQDGVLNMEYNEAVQACHLGIFPSFYEPWGYTPLESIALSVPAITTTLAGFGQYLQDKVVGQYQGLYIVNRSNTYQHAVDDLHKVLERFVSFDHKSRVACKLKAHALATFADWRQLVLRYIKAHNDAVVKHS